MWIQAHIGYANIIIGIFNSLWARLFFRKYGFNIFEILIALCFYMGISMLIFTIFAFSTLIFPIDVLQIGGIVGFVYGVWALGQFFDKTRIISYAKSRFAYIVGMITFFLSTFLLAVIIDCCGSTIF